MLVPSARTLVLEAGGSAGAVVAVKMVIDTGVIQ